MEAIEDVSHPYAHKWEYCAAMADSSGLETYLYVGKDQEKKILCPVNIRMKEEGYPEIVSPYGFGGIVSTFSAKDFDNFYTEWTGFWRDKGFVTAFIMQHPSFKVPETMWSNDLQEYRNLYLIDLSSPLEEIWREMGKTHRYEVRRWRRESDICLVTDKTRLKETILELYPQTVKRVGASKVYHFVPETLIRLAETPGSLLLGVEENNRVEAVAQFLYTFWSADYFLNASSLEGRKYTRLLVWTAIERLKEYGVACLNLGGGVKQGDSLDKFKRRFGGQMVRGQVIKQIFNQAKYEYLLNKYDYPIDANTSYFPLYWLDRTKKVTPTFL
jgi:hypothetical protein